jgi:hypothetical protein
MHSIRVVLLFVFLAGAALGQTVTLSNDSTWRDYPDFVVSDQFTLTVSGAAASKPVTMDATRDGDSTLYNWSLGTTDSNGDLPVIGTMGSWNVGMWHEIVSVDGTAIGEFDFSVEEPEACIFSPYGTETLPLMYSVDYYYSDANSALTFTFTPQEVTHENTDGPCGAAPSGMASTYYMDADYERDSGDYDYEDGGFKKADWTINLSNRTAYGDRMNPLMDSDTEFSFVNGMGPYPVYESGYVQSVFQHRDTGEEFLRTTYYNLMIDGCALVLENLVCSYDF